MRPCSPITKWESGQVTLKGLSNTTGNFDLKSSFNLFHYVAKGSLACFMTSRKEAGFQGYFAPGTPLARDFPDKSRNRHTGLETMPQILERLKAQTRGQKLYCLLPWWLRGLSVCLQCGRPEFDPWVGKIPGEGNSNPFQYSCLETVLLPWREEPGRLQSMGSRRVRHNWATSLSSLKFFMKEHGKNHRQYVTDGSGRESIKLHSKTQQ